MTRISHIIRSPNPSIAPPRKGASNGEAPEDFMTALRDLLAATSPAVKQPKPNPALAVQEPDPDTNDAEAPKSAQGDAAATNIPTMLTPDENRTGAADTDVNAADNAQGGVPGPLLSALVAAIADAGFDRAKPAAPAAEAGTDPATAADTDKTGDSAEAPARRTGAPVTGAVAMQTAATTPAPLAVAAAIAASVSSLVNASTGDAAAIARTGNALPQPGRAPSGPGALGVTSPDHTAVAAPGVAAPGAARLAAPSMQVTLDARWLPTQGDAARAVGAGAPVSGRASPLQPLPDDASAATDDGAVDAAPPPRDDLAKMIAAVVRDVTHASAPTTTSSKQHHTADDSTPDGDGGDVNVPVPAAAPADMPAYASLSLSTSTGVRGGTDRPSTESVDPGPRSLPEPKGTPAPTAHATLELDAEKTGASRIRIAVQGAQVRATITASDAGAAALDRQLPDLRRSLEERGFSDIRLTVHAQEHSGAVASGASPSSDDARSFNRSRSDGQAQRYTEQKDTGDRAGSQRRRRDNEEDQ